MEIARKSKGNEEMKVGMNEEMNGRRAKGILEAKFKHQFSVLGQGCIECKAGRGAS